MSKTKMPDYFKCIKKHEIQLSRKLNHAPSGKKLNFNTGESIDSLSLGCKDSAFLKKNDLPMHSDKKTVIESIGQISSPRKRKRSDEANVASIPKVMKVITSKNVGGIMRKPQNAGRIAQISASLQKINNISSKLKRGDELASKITKPAIIVSTGAEVHHSLASEEAVKLGLPYKYKVLTEIFRSLDSVVMIMHNRHEVCHFLKLKSAVQQILRRAFNVSHLGQVATVFPSGYIFKQEKVHLYKTEGKVIDYQLTVHPNFDCFSNGLYDDVVNIDSAGTSQAFRSMTPNFMASRQKFFNDSLLASAKKHHEKFLASLHPPIKLSSEKLNRWHPQFKLDGVPDISPTIFPEPENEDKCYTAKDVLARIQGLYSDRIDNALATVASRTQDVLQEPVVPNNPIIKPSAFKGIPSALLEKIRLRESEKMKSYMTSNPATEFRLAMASQLPEISRILGSLFVAEKRVSIPYSLAVRKVKESAVGSVSLDEMERIFSFLIELVPEWLTVIELRSGKFIKINKKIDCNDITNKLENEKKKIEQSR